MVSSNRQQDLLRNFNIAAVFVVLILASIGAQAQSGRRAPKGTKTVPTISGPREVAKPPAPVKDDRIPLVVAIEEHNPFSGIPYYLAGTVRDTCAVHLRASSSVKVEIVGRSISRSEAVKRAKAEKEIYVVWLQIESDAFDRTGSSNESPESLYVRYTVFTPVTGKIKSSGRTSQISRTGRGGVLGRIPTSRGSSIYSEYALKEAAREVAEQVLEAFSIHPPDSRLP
ncbi:MAG: hypothetical protein ABI596_11595 [Pyrinomonadaceae bacterium]